MCIDTGHGASCMTNHSAQSMPYAQCGVGRAVP
jgi:hypothetical protein